MLELNATLKEFTDRLCALVKQIINFEEIYSSVYALPPTRVITKRSQEKIKMDGIPAECSRLKRVNILMQYIKFVQMLNPDVPLPPDITNADYDEIISQISNIQTATNDNSCFYKNAQDEKPITCKTILTGEHTDINLIDRLNALGDLRKSDGHDRDKDENTLSLLIEHLGLGDFAKDKDKDQDLSTLQFYFTINLRMCMNRVLKHVMHSMILFHNIASFLYIKMLCMKPHEVKKESDSTEQSALDNAIVTLKKLVENSLMLKFPAFRYSLDILTASDTVKETLQHEIASRNGVTIDDIKESLSLIAKWQSILDKRFSQLTIEQDNIMSKMMIVLLNYKTELGMFFSKIRKLDELSSKIQKCLPSLNEQLEKVRVKEESAATGPKGKSHKRRSSLFSSLNITGAVPFIDAAFGKDTKEVVISMKSSV